MNQAESDQLVEWLASVSNDPVGFVYGAFPWDDPNGPLWGMSPDPWQLDILTLIKDGLLTIDEAVKIAVASGHGIGKTALVAWIILWAFTTYPETIGRVTAGTEAQLKSTTWKELAKWYDLFIGKELFVMSATRLRSRDPEKELTWFLDAIPWSESNPHAFAGVHNYGKRIIYIFDEGSTISDVIYETAEGALTDKNTQIIWCVFGNPIKNSGRFRELFPGQRYNKGWKTRSIDSRTVAITNKADIALKLELHGEDSDYARIRITGQFPRTGLLEFFNAEDISNAMAREPVSNIPDALILGVDVARFGANESVIQPRKGRDAKTFPAVRRTSLSTISLASLTISTLEELHADGICVDEGGVGGGVVDYIRHMRYHCFGVQFGAKPDGAMPAVLGIQGERYANKRAEMYGCLRAWLRTGAIADDPELKAQLLGITYTFNRQDQIILTSKEDMMKDGKPSPDWVDSLALTFAHPVAPAQASGGLHQQKPQVQSEYDPYEPQRMAS